MKHVRELLALSLTKFRMRVYNGEHPPEHLGWNGVHLVEHDEPPLLRLQPLHGLLRLPRAALSVRDHGVRGYEDAGTHWLVFGFRCEPFRVE